MKLDQELFEQIVELLQPHMSESGRKTLITPAFTAYGKLYSRIEWSGSSQEFTVRIVEQFTKYGQVTPDQEALTLLLETLRKQVGWNVQSQIDDVLGQLASLPSRTIVASSKGRSVLSFVALIVLAVFLLATLYLFPSLSSLIKSSNATAALTLVPTPAVTDTPSAAGCEYTIVVRDLVTEDPISDAKITLEYKLKPDSGYTNPEGYYSGAFQCQEKFPFYRLRIDADGYQPHYTTVTLQAKIEEIYLISTATRFCPHTISVIDRENRNRVADAKIQIEYGAYHTVGYTDTDGYYKSELPCAEKSPSLKVWVYAEGYDSYNVNYIIQNKIQEIRLPSPAPTPTPTSTPIPFSSREEGEILILVVDFWVSNETEDKQRFALRLKNEMTKKLEDYSQIRVEYWKEAISPDEGGGNLAKQIGSNSSVDATFVIWGYRQPKEDEWGEDEIYVYLDVMRDELPFFDSQYHEGYLLSPPLFDFATNLGSHWTNLTALATGLIFYQAQNYDVAEQLFAIAIELSNSSTQLKVDTTTLSTVHFYRGMNYLHLGHFLEAEAELIQLERDIEVRAEDQFSTSVIYSLGLLYSGMGEYERALNYYNQALTLYGVADDRQGQRNARLQLAMIYEAQDELKQAERQMRMAIQIGEFLDHPNTEIDREKLTQIQEEIEKSEEESVQSP